MKIKKYKMMFGSGKGSKFRPEHTAKRLKSYTNQSAKARIKLAGLTGELEQKAEKRRRNGQGQLSSDGTRKTSSQLKLEKQVSAAFAKVRSANVGMAKHTIRSVLATELKRAPTYAAKQSLITKANDQLKLTQSEAQVNIAKKELERKLSRPKQRNSKKTQSMLTLEKQISLGESKKINATTGLQTQNIKNTLKKLQSQSSSKNQTAAEKRLAYYTIKKLTANAAKAKANIELQRKKKRTTNPKFTESMKRLAEQSSRAGTQSIQAGISMEKHQGRLSGVTPFTSKKALTSVAGVLKPVAGVAGVAEVLKPLAGLYSQTLNRVKQEQLSLSPMNMTKQMKGFEESMKTPVTGVDVTSKLNQPTDTSKIVSEQQIVLDQDIKQNLTSTSPSLLKTTPTKQVIIQPHKTQLEILKEKEDTTKIHSTELKALLNSFMKGENITTPTNMEEILKASKINNTTISKTDGTITQDKIKLFLSTPETITKLQNYQTQLDTNKTKITENISKIEANTTKLHTIQETHTEYKTIKSEIETKQAAINELKARQQLLFNSNQMNKLDTPANQKLQQQINNAETEKTKLETKKTELKTKLVENTKDLTQTLVKSKSLNNQIKQIEQNPDVYYGQMMSKYKTANTTKNEASLKTYILAYGSPAEKEIIKLKNSSNHQKQEKKSMIETKQQTKVNLEAQIKELEQQKTNINKEDITKKNQELETQKTEKEKDLQLKKNQMNEISTSFKQIESETNEEIQKLQENYKQKIAEQKELNYKPKLDALEAQQRKPGISNSEKQIISNNLIRLKMDYLETISENFTATDEAISRIREESLQKAKDLTNKNKQLIIEGTKLNDELKIINKEKATIVSQLEKDATITKEIENKIAATQTQISEVDAELEKVMPVVKKSLVEEPLTTVLEPLTNSQVVAPVLAVTGKESNKFRRLNNGKILSNLSNNNLSTALKNSIKSTQNNLQKSTITNQESKNIFGKNKNEVTPQDILERILRHGDSSVYHEYHGNISKILSNSTDTRIQALKKNIFGNSEKKIVVPEVVQVEQKAVKEAPVLAVPEVVKEATVVKEAVENVNNNNPLSPEFTTFLNKRANPKTKANTNLKEKTEAELAKEQNALSGYMDL